MQGIWKLGVPTYDRQPDPVAPTSPPSDTPSTAEAQPEKMPEKNALPAKRTDGYKVATWLLGRGIWTNLSRLV